MVALERQILPLWEGCHLDLFQEQLVKDKLPIALSRIQFRILYCLVRNEGRLVTATELIISGWGSIPRVSSNDLRVHISRLRQKLGDNARAPRYILAVHRVGYILNLKDPTLM